MAKLYLYAVICALLSAAQWRGAGGSPVRTPLSLDSHCPSLAKSLLQNIRELLNNSSTFHVTVCSNKALELKNNTHTVLACAPHLTQNAACMRQINTPFSESECVGNIMKDLAHYAGALQSYLRTSSRLKKTPLFNSTLAIIQSLQENCSLAPVEERDSSELSWSQEWTDTSFNNRQKMCKLMTGFHVRAITINRAMSYISSGDHRM